MNIKATHYAATTDSDTTISSSHDNDMCTKLTKNNRKIEAWLSKRSKKEIVFLLSSYSGENVTMYDEFGSIARLIRVSMDGQYLIMGEQTIVLNSDEIDISLGLDSLRNNTNSSSNGKNTTVTDDSNSNDIDINSVELSNERSEFSNTPQNNRQRRSIGSSMENTAKMNNHLSCKHCIVLHLKTGTKDIVLEFANTRKRYLWAKGLTRLMALGSSKRLFRYKVISYILEKCAYALNYYTTQAIGNDRMDKHAKNKYFEKRQRCSRLMNKYVFVKCYSISNENDRDNNDAQWHNDKINIDLIRTKKTEIL